jgi:hypothetical protein
MNWKTCSVEVRAAIRQEDGNPRNVPESFCHPERGMQKHKLTMCAVLVIVVWFREFIQACCALLVFLGLLCGRPAVGLLRNAFSN